MKEEETNTISKTRRKRLKTPQQVLDQLSIFDARNDTFSIHDVQSAISSSIELKSLSDDIRRGYWAEVAAFVFNTHSTTDGGSRQAYFQPIFSLDGEGGTAIYRPGTKEVDVEVINYWASRARSVKHPTLAARYADLAWDLGKNIPGHKTEVEFARLAIDSYIAALRLDGGDAWGDNRDNVERVLRLSMSISDIQRVNSAVDAIIDYADRTSQEDQIGTYCYLFELLLPAKKGPPISAAKEKMIVTMFETRFGKMIVPGSPYDVDPHSPQSIGLLLASYYGRNNRTEDRIYTLVEIAKAFERRANVGDAISGVMFLKDAHRYYIDAGKRSEAERVLREIQALAPQAKEGMACHTYEYEISEEDRMEFLNGMMAGGVESGFREWTIHFVPRQTEIREWKVKSDNQFPFQAMFAPTILNDEGIQANVDDTRGDPDGPMIWETQKRMGLSTVWISWGLDHLIKNGLDSEAFVKFINPSPVFDQERLPLIKQGIDAHLRGDYIQSIHILVPQIERALVLLMLLLGESNTKTHRTGRGVLQSMNMNDALANDAVRNALGEDLRMYLSASLSHPKGLNIRNEVCHGLWKPSAFTKYASERVIHTMAALSLIRKSTQPDEDSD